MDSQTHNVHNGHLNNEDPEPNSKIYNAGGTELPEQELVRKTTKRRKTQYIVEITSPTHHTQQNNNSTIHNVSNPMQDLSQDYLEHYLKQPSTTHQ